MRLYQKILVTGAVIASAYILGDYLVETPLEEFKRYCSPHSQAFPFPITDGGLVMNCLDPPGKTIFDLDEILKE